MSTDEHQKSMINKGLVKKLLQILNSKSADPSLHAKALALIQYFDKKYQQTIIASKGFLKQLARLLDTRTAEKKFAFSLIMKTLSVISGFDCTVQDFAFSFCLEFPDEVHEKMIRDGLLDALVALLGSNNERVVVKTFEVIQGLSEAITPVLLKSGYLKKLIDALSSSSKSVFLIGSFLKYLVLIMLNLIALEATKEYLPNQSETLKE